MSTNESDKSLFLRQQILAQAPVVFQKEQKFDLLVCHDPSEGAYYAVLIGLKRDRYEGTDASLRILVRGQYTQLGRVQAMELLLGILLTETHNRIQKEIQRMGLETLAYQEATERAYVASRSYPA
ncbi:MAG: hypothetical protein M1821_003704 [Bathelium mastoideum]|nr:MAG: hypothetical protein M1821_003704 [Bathelium mastoideum]KAI9690786.1 MAG: hypothetical protein M1822_008405 [Bathelium mastoideum]